jgi:hypothetical protein
MVPYVPLLMPEIQKALQVRTGVTMKGQGRIIKI